MEYEYRRLTPEERATLLEQRRARGYPPHSPPHPVVDRPFYLLTAACYEHKPHMMASQRRRQLLDAHVEQFRQAGGELVAWAVLPNHYHVLAGVADVAVLGELFRATHGRLSRQWNMEDHALGRKVWYCYSDRAIRSEGHYLTTLNYIHYNPVKHGWAESPYDWAESSVGWYLQDFGREWLRDLWVRYPLRAYGQGWDDVPGREDVGAGRVLS